MDYDSYSRPSEGPSLAVKLMQVAGEWELAKKREVQSWQSKLADKEAALLRAERLLRDANEKNQELTRNIARAEEELEHAAAKADNSVNGLQHTLLSVRFQLGERLQQLEQLQDAYLELQRGVEQALVAVDIDSTSGTDENAEPDAQQVIVAAKRAVAGPVLALRTLVSNGYLPSHKVAEVRAAAKAASRWSASALLAAVKAGHESEVLSLLTGAPSHAQAQGHGEEDDSALHPALRGAVTQGLRAAISNGNISMVKLLLSAGADLSSRSLEDGLLHDALHTAAGAGQEAMMRYLLGRDANGAAISRDQAPAAAAGLSIDTPDSYGRTCLHLAAAVDSASTVKLLLMVGADPDCKDVHGHTAADVAGGTEEYSKPERPAQAGRKPEGWAYASGELPTHPRCATALAVLTDPNLSFWNASVRANRYYNERAFEKAIGAYSKALELAPLCSMPTSARDMATLHYNRARARYRIGAHVAAVEDCTAALNKDASYRNALAQRAECFMSLFDLERAARDFQSLLEADPSDRQWGRRLTEARAMRDMSHYGVLGVPKDADGSTVKKAYRALCLRWHPDKVEQGSAGAGNGQGSPLGEGGAGSAGIGRQEASLRANIVFRRLTDAYETLSDTYKRMIYDMDPRSNNSTPTAAAMAAAAKAAGAGSGAAGPREGFEKWATKELEREEERDKERMSAAAVHAAQVLAEEEARARARATRVRILSASASTTQQARTSVAPKPAPAPVPSAPRPALPHSASMGPSTSASVRAASAAQASAVRAAPAAQASAVPHPPGQSPGTAGPAPLPHGMGGAGAHASSPSTHAPPLLRRAASDGSLPAPSQPPPPARPTPGQAACPSPPARRVRVGDSRAGPASPTPVPSDEAAAAVRQIYGSTTRSVKPEGLDARGESHAQEAQEGPSTARAGSAATEADSATGSLQAAAAATAARARAAVAQAEAFVRLVQQQAAEGAFPHVPSSTSGSTASHHEEEEEEEGVAEEEEYTTGAYRSSAEFMAGLDKAALRARVAARARGEPASTLPSSTPPLPSPSFAWPSASVTQPVDMSGLEGVAGYDGDEGSDEGEGEAALQGQGLGERGVEDEERLSMGDVPSAGEGSSLGGDAGDAMEEPHVQVGQGYSLDQEAELLRRLDAAAAAAAAAISPPSHANPGPGQGGEGARYRPMDDRELTALLERLGM